MDSSHSITLLLIGQPLLRRTLSLQMHEALRQRIAVHYHLEGLTREELQAYLAQQLKAGGLSEPLFDERTDETRTLIRTVLRPLPRNGGEDSNKDPLLAKKN